MKFADMPDVLIGTSTEQAVIDKGEQAISNAIYNILTTPVGVVPGHPLFGCNINKYLFEIMDPLISKLVEEEVSYSLRLWEPRISVGKIDVSDDPDYNRLTVKIYYSIITDPRNTEREYIFSTQR